MPPLSPADEEIAEKYRKMLRMGMPEGAVMHKMAVDGVEPHIEIAVLSSSNGSPPATTQTETTTTTNDAADDAIENPAKPRSSQSFIEEEIVYDDDDDDEALEEEIIDEDGMIEEEIVVDDEDGNQNNVQYVNDATQDNQQYRPEDVEDPYRSDRQNEYYEVGVQEQAPIPKPKTPVKQLSSPSLLWYWISCLFMLCFVGAAAGVGYWLSTQTQDVTQIEPDTGTNAPTPTPVEITSRFSPVQGQCAGISSLTNPNPVDQCDCFGRIDIIPRDVRESYQFNLEVYISMLYETWDEEISSCSPQNAALVWTSSVPDLTDSNWTQFYGLTTTFVGLGGSSWRNRTNWLSYTDPCDWAGISCHDNGLVSELVIAENNANGVVGFTSRGAW
jgi:hypothetical protein